MKAKNVGLRGATPDPFSGLKLPTGTERDEIRSKGHARGLITVLQDQLRPEALLSRRESMLGLREPIPGLRRPTPDITGPITSPIGHISWIHLRHERDRFGPGDPFQDPR